jgi:glycerophosphoryl diester phosphodiesterase
MNKELDRNRGILFSLLVFLIANALKVQWIEYFIVQAKPPSSLSELMFFRPWIVTLLFFAFSGASFFFLWRLRNGIFFLLFYLLQAVYLILHVAYYCFFGELFYISQVSTKLFEGVELIRHQAVPMNARYLLTIIDLPFVCLVVVKYKELHALVRRYSAAFLVVIFLLILTATLGAFYQNDFFDYAQDVFEEISGEQFSSGEKDVVRHVGLAGSDLLDILFQKSESEKMRSIQYGSKKTFLASTGRQASNIICIQVESLDPSVIDAQYKGRYIVPFLNKLSRASVFYPHMIFYYGGGRTSDMEFTAINGARPLRKSPVFRLKHYSYPNSLPHRIPGYEALAFHNNTGEFFNRKTAFSKMGFRKLYDMNDMRLTEVGWGAPDASMMDYITHKLKEQPSPFFYYIVTMSSHEPYQTPLPYYKNDLFQDIPDELLRNYYNAISYVDSSLRDFITFIQANLKNTYVFIYGDHLAFGQTSFLLNPTKSVPLFILTPDGKQYYEKNKVASALDLEITLLYASGASFSAETQGVNLLDFPIREDEVMLFDGRKASRELLYQQLADIVQSPKEKKELAKKAFAFPELVAHGGGEINGVVTTNSLQALEASRQKGFTFIEVDVERTTDKKWVLMHDWQEDSERLFGAKPQRCSLSEFKNLKMINGLSQLTFDQLIDWMRAHPNIVIITDTKDDNVSLLEHIADSYPEMKGRFIPQIYAFEEYEPAKKLGFENLILTLYKSSYGKSGKNDNEMELWDFLSEHRVFALTMPTDERAWSDLPKALNKMNLFVFAHTVNDVETKNRLKDNSVNGFYTDFLLPSSPPAQFSTSEIKDQLRQEANTGTERKDFHCKALIEQANAYRQQNRFGEAEAIYKKAIEINPQASQAYSELADSYGDQGKYAEAEQAYRMAIKLDSRNDRAYTDLGDIYIHQNKPVAAEDFYKKAIELNPKNRRAMFKLGLLYKQQKKQPEAIRFFEAIVARDPDNDAAHDVLNVFYGKSEGADLAETYRKGSSQTTEG